MSRRSRNRNRNDEINLTPLLDVLFTILFIVMLTSVQSEKIIQSEVENSKDQVKELTEKVEQLENELRREEAVNDTEKRYNSNAVLVTMLNDVEDGNHILKIYTGQDGRLIDSFRLGFNRSQYIGEHLSSVIQGIVDESKDCPVFIVFHCNTHEIYRREEFVPIKGRLELLKAENKEVFYQIVEE